MRLSSFSFLLLLLVFLIQTHSVVFVSFGCLGPRTFRGRAVTLCTARLFFFKFGEHRLFTYLVWSPSDVDTDYASFWLLVLEDHYNPYHRSHMG